MIVLGINPEGGRDAEAVDHASGGHVVLIFGLGMIGRAIENALIRLGFQREQDIPFSWENSESRRTAGERIESAYRSLQRMNNTRLSVVWSAGKAGFHSSETELMAENSAFEDVLELMHRLSRPPPAASLNFHYMSSAGGLFEGQQVVSLSSPPVPLRPYGEMKLHQERLIAKRLPGAGAAVYRPSSVYGPYFQGSRHGLINHLVNNGRRARVTVLDAQVMALRDYVYSGDIGQFVGRAIRFGLPPAVGTRAYFLVSARCASIFEVVGKIQRVLKLKIPYRLDENYGNHRNITFSEHVLPFGWRPSSLEVGIRQFLVQPAA